MGRPFAVWVTVVISAILSVVAAFGLLKIIMQVPHGFASGGGIAAWRLLLMIFIQTVATGFLVAVAYAAIARQRWGQVLCAVFAVLITLLMIYQGFHPDPHPLFVIHPGAEAAGAVIARLAMGLLFCLYAYKMLVGARVRAYFKSAAK